MSFSRRRSCLRLRIRRILPIPMSHEMKSAQLVACRLCGGILFAAHPGDCCARCMFDAALLPVPTDESEVGLAAGDTLFGGRYQLRRMLGRGGMGVVWLAWAEHLEREVALKFLPAVFVTDLTALDDLKRETRRSLELTHHHMVRIHDFHQEDEIAAISMEYVDGDTLRNLLHEQPSRCFEVETLRPWLTQLCAALAYAHGTARVAHRDLKPGNLMINRTGELKVADFGIAASLRASLSRVTRRPVSGTPAYMSPQQFAGELPTVADDFYALGATIYELLTGAPPFRSGEIASQVLETIPPSITERRRELAIAGAPIPSEWEETVAACLEKDPVRRPQSATALGERLTRHCEASGKKQEAVSAISGPSLRIWTAVVLANVGLLMGMFVWSWFDGRPGSEPIVTPSSFISNTSLREPDATDANSKEDGKRPKEQARFVNRAGPHPGQPWENALGMKFVPVGTVLMSVWLTRVQDYNAFCDVSGRARLIADFPQDAAHPAVRVNADDAEAFCEWLTKLELAAGQLDEGQRYRLPTDAEWSLAAGVANEGGATPEERDGKSRDFPWGKQWPPPAGAGNFADGTGRRAGTIAGYHDGFAQTSPVGSFAANALGLFDLSGNVWQWCDDFYKPGARWGVLRGGSWGTAAAGELRTSYRNVVDRSERDVIYGFRCVLVVAGP